MYCSNCGKKISSNIKYCNYCGSKQSSSNNKEQSLQNEHIHTKNIEKKSTYASFSIRLGAYVIDFGVIMVMAYVFGYLLSYLFAELAIYIIDVVPDLVLGYIIFVVYNTISLYCWSTTFGKYLYGLKVADEQRNSLDHTLALKRSLLQPFSTIFFGIGYWNMNKNSRKQAWHDKQVHTVIIRKEKSLALAYLLTISGVFIYLYLIYYSG